VSLRCVECRKELGREEALASGRKLRGCWLTSTCHREPKTYGHGQYPTVEPGLSRFKHSAGLAAAASAPRFGTARDVDRFIRLVFPLAVDGELALGEAESTQTSEA